MIAGGDHEGLPKATPSQLFAQLGLQQHEELDPKRQICFDFTKGSCTRGAACKYSHDVDLIASINSLERGICFDFIRGQCNRDVLCRFSHDMSTIQSQQCEVGTPHPALHAPTSV